MHTDWRTFLEHRGAHIVQSTVADFGDPEGETSAAYRTTAIADFSSQGLLEVTGDDAEKFLQGQLTNDLAAITTSHSALAAWCNPKGRVEVLFRVVRHSEGFWLSLPRDLLANAVKKLGFYRLRAKVDIADRSDHFGQILLTGEEMGDLAEIIGVTPPARPNQVAVSDATCCVRLPGAPARYLLLAPYSALQLVWERLGDTRPVGEPAMLLGAILAGQPSINAPNAAQFLPQMINLDRIDAVSFTKGCYTGQEIVARTQHLGRIKRRMFVGRGESPPPADGAEIALAGHAGVKGRVVTAAPHPDGGSALLAVLPLEQALDGDWRLADETPVRIDPAPYALSDG